MRFHLAQGDAFLDQLLAIPPNRAHQIQEKVRTLQHDPLPDGVHKKKLKGSPPHLPLYRIRSGDYRVVYSIEGDWVTLRKVDNRGDVYDGSYDSEPLTPPELVDEVPAGNTSAPDGGKRTPAPEAVQRYLPARLDETLLARLRIPPECFPALTVCRTEDDLMAAAVPGAVLETIVNVIFSDELDVILRGPTYVLHEVEDLLRYVEGDLPGFLLKLDPTQMKMVDWGMKGTGPTLVKGGPGTGKSTVALYRVQAMVRALLAEGNPKPRLLFTTYTNALVAFSQQLLRRLLGENARFVEVRTADSVVSSVLNSLGVRQRILNDRELLPLLRQALERSGESARGGKDGIVLRAAPKLSLEYLLEEINGVIEAREIGSLVEYCNLRRHGRRAAINGNQRMSLWRVYEEFDKLLDERYVTSYARSRRQAATMVRAGAGPKPYDGVVIDEVQDLNPSVLRLLTLLCARPNRLFITADANQSIYGGTFRWADVHTDLKFRGRTEVLRQNYRSTREIGEAAQSYLQAGALDQEDAGERSYVQTGGYIPTVLSVLDVEEEAAALAGFLPGAARSERLGLSACAILVPGEEIGKTLTARLQRANLPARYMPGKELDLEAPAIKVISLKSAKGLEFPIVAIAGLVGIPTYGMKRTNDPEEREEHIWQERRTLYVGMTRAMRVLLVMVPARAPSPIFHPFEPELWTVSEMPAAV